MKPCLPLEQALNPGAGIYLSNRGVAFTIPEGHPAHLYMLLAFRGRVCDRLFDTALGKKAAGENGTVFPDLSRWHSDSFRPAFHHLVGLRRPSEDGCPQTRRI